MRCSGMEGGGEGAFARRDLQKVSMRREKAGCNSIDFLFVLKRCVQAHVKHHKYFQGAVALIFNGYKVLFNNNPDPVKMTTIINYNHHNDL